MSESPTISLDRAPGYGAELQIEAEREVTQEVALPEPEQQQEPDVELSDHQDLDVIHDLDNQSQVYRATGEFVNDTGLAETLASLPADILAECVKCAHGAVDGLDHFMGFDNFPDGVQVSPDAISAALPERDTGIQIG